MKKLIVVLAGVLSLVLVTGAHAAEIFSKNLKYGQVKNSEVKRLQEFLKDEGYYRYDITGNYYLITKTAVTNFQKAYNIKANGIFDLPTRTKANDLLTAKDLDVIEVNDSTLDYTPSASTFSPTNQPSLNTLNTIMSTDPLPYPDPSPTPVPPPTQKTPEERKAICLADTESQYQKSVSSIRNFDQEIANARAELARRTVNLNACLANPLVGSFWDPATQQYVNLGEAQKRGLTTLTLDQWCSGQGDNAVNWSADVQDAQNKLDQVIQLAADFERDATQRLQDSRAASVATCNAIVK